MPVAQIVLAENDGVLTGFVTVDPKTMYLDQIVVAPEHWGSGVALALLDEAKRLSPRGLDLLVNKDNARAIRFYEKHGFDYAGEDKNPVSGKPVNRMSWRPASALRRAGERCRHRRVEAFGIHFQISELLFGDHHRHGDARHLTQARGKAFGIAGMAVADRHQLAW